MTDNTNCDIDNMHLMCNDCQCEVLRENELKNPNTTQIEASFEMPTVLCYDCQCEVLQENELQNPNTTQIEASIGAHGEKELENSKILCNRLDMLQEQLNHFTTRGELVTATQNNTSLQKQLKRTERQHNKVVKAKNVTIDDLELRLQNASRSNDEMSKKMAAMSRMKIANNASASSTYDTAAFATKWNLSKSSRW